jgi:hypothetical protein
MRRNSEKLAPSRTPYFMDSTDAEKYFKKGNEIVFGT